MKVNENGRKFLTFGRSFMSMGSQNFDVLSRGVRVDHFTYPTRTRCR